MSCVPILYASVTLAPVTIYVPADATVDEIKNAVADAVATRLHMSKGIIGKGLYIHAPEERMVFSDRAEDALGHMPPNNKARMEALLRGDRTQAGQLAYVDHLYLSEAQAARKAELEAKAKADAEAAAEKRRENMRNLRAKRKGAKAAA